MKLIKVRFTSWRDQSAAPRSPLFQEQLDVWTKRISELSLAVARIRDGRAHAGNELLQDSLAEMIADLEKIEAERALLLSVEATAAQVETLAARQHKKVGTFGYHVLNDVGSHVGYIVDEAGSYLPPKAVYAYEVVDDDPPLPDWAKKGTVGR